MRRLSSSFCHWRTDAGGASAIEFAMILPAMVLLYAGLVDLTAYLSTDRKITAATGMLGDLVTQNTAVSAAQIDDYFTAAHMATNPIDESEVGLQVWDYRKIGPNVVLQWSKAFAGGATCADPDTSNIANLMAAGNDIVVAAACMTFQPPMSHAIGTYVLGAPSFDIDHHVELRPREAGTLNCADC